ncbi:hypothetical protein CABS01_02921 [Colletotrichum abscissum]|uniref:BTB domain-containing protein n=1 Tax=Colletotrichum abscissum TaxID=1671311 RepID=A0A9P9XM27_9PEZI|nr:uncharacterized protein CABS01_02921 [Colletotrichum abscissum]KAI3555762.1 hypothetical protein CABS02_04138 [Colletotrichum abscissum]KAK1483185.1 hypothetical protein CABS01_02921 [Colletotrichum abscissum]
MVVNVSTSVSPWRCDASAADDVHPHSATAAFQQQHMPDPRYSREIFETCSIPVKIGNPPLAPKPAFATTMSKKKLSGKQIASSDSSGRKKSRRDRLSALFGHSPERVDDAADDKTAPHDEATPTKATASNRRENENHLQNSAANLEDDPKENGTRDSVVTIVTTRSVTTEDKDAHESGAAASADKIDTIDFANKNQIRGKTLEVKPCTKLTIDEAISNPSPSRMTKLPIHRHKRASSSFKIVDRDSADAVLLSAFSYNPSPEKKNSAVAKPSTQAPSSTQLAQHNQRHDQEAPLLPSSTYSGPTIHNSEPQNKHSQSKLKGNSHANHDCALSSYPEPGSAIKITDTDEEIARKLEATAFTPAAVAPPPNPLLSALKTYVSDKSPGEKKVRFAAGSSVKSGDSDNESGVSDDSDKTIKPGTGGMKAASNSILSPTVWDKSAEPKIWVKNGKPTLFQPQKDPGYYTNPLWSRQYPEILSDDPRVNPYGPSIAGSTTSTDGSQYSDAPAARAVTDFEVGNKLHSNGESSTNVNFGTGAAPARTLFTRTTRGTMPSPPGANQNFVGRDFPEIPTVPAGFGMPPLYRGQIKLEIGGRRFVSSMDVLERSPWFKYIFSINFRDWYRDGVFHFDNDGDLFAHILRFLRTGMYPLFWDARNGFDYAMYAMIQQQARYYMLYDLEAWIAQQKYQDVVETQVIHQKFIIPNSQGWIHEQSLTGLDTSEISGVAEHPNVALGRQSESQAPVADMFFSDNGVNSKGKAKAIAPQQDGPDGAVALFTTEKVVKVHMNQLRPL